MRSKNESAKNMNEQVKQPNSEQIESMFIKQCKNLFYANYEKSWWHGELWYMDTIYNIYLHIYAILIYLPY